MSGLRATFSRLRSVMDRRFWLIVGVYAILVIAFAVVVRS